MIPLTKLRFHRKYDPFFQTGSQKRAAFQKTLDNVTQLLHSYDEYSPISHEVHMLNVLDFSINLIGKEMSYTIAARLLHIGQITRRQNYWIPVGIRKEEADGKMVDLSSISIISDTYSFKKMRRAITDVASVGCQHTSDISGICYPEIHLAVIDNGRHHISASIPYRQASCKMQILHLTDVFDTLRTDGAFWYQGQSQPVPVDDYRLAVLYELARIRHTLNAPQDEQLLKKSAFYAECHNPFSADIEQLYRIKWLEMELNIKQYQLDQLTGKKQTDVCFQKIEQSQRLLLHKLEGWIRNEGYELLQARLDFEKQNQLIQQQKKEEAFLHE